MLIGEVALIVSCVSSILTATAINGQMVEWLMTTVLKTVLGSDIKRGFKSYFARHNIIPITEKCINVYVRWFNSTMDAIVNRYV